MLLVYTFNHFIYLFLSYFCLFELPLPSPNHRTIITPCSHFNWLIPIKDINRFSVTNRPVREVECSIGLKKSLLDKPRNCDWLIVYRTSALSWSVSKRLSRSPLFATLSDKISRFATNTHKYLTKNAISLGCECENFVSTCWRQFISMSPHPGWDGVP